MTASNPFQKATRRILRARVALDGPTGAGKTWTALEWARVLGERIALIDTERGSSASYVGYFDFDVLDMRPPYEPHRLEAALGAAEANGYDVVVIDSLSHFWDGEGGVLDTVDGAAQRAQGNSFAGWKTGTPLQRHMIDTLLGLDLHVICTMRSKMEYVLETNKRGKQVPRKVGLAPVQRAGVEYEFTLVGDLDLEHRLTISKSRCHDLADVVIQPGRAAEAAATFKAWLEDGEPLAARNDIDALMSLMNAVEPGERRKACKEAFVGVFGRPDQLVASKVPDARAFVATYNTSTASYNTSAPDDASDDDDAAAPDADGGLPAADWSDTGPAVPAASFPTNVDLGKAAGVAFRQAMDAAPRGTKSKLADRLRYALTYAQTSGRVWHLDDLTTEERRALHARLDDIAKGRLGYEVDDDGVDWLMGDRRIRVEWAQFEPAGAAA